MKNPLKTDHADPDRDNPVVPNAVESPVERAAERAAMHDNPIVPNAIERPSSERRAATGTLSSDVLASSIGRVSTTGPAIAPVCTTVRRTSRADEAAQMTR